MNDDIEPTIWQPANPTPGWTQAAKDSNLTVFLPLEGNLAVPMFFRRIPAGEFRMGSRGYELEEESVHRVKIPEDFLMATFPVTQKQFACWTESPAYAYWLAKNRERLDEDHRGPHRNHFTGTPLLPAERVSWWEAVGYCEWLAKLSGRAIRLPSEAEWEYACRAGTDTEYWSGDGEAALADVGWHDENSQQKSHPVGELNRPNLNGLHDVHGNVWEWCADIYDPNAYRKRPALWQAATWGETGAGDDATYWSDEDRKSEKRYRVLRGGSWDIAARGCRSAFRAGVGPDFRLKRFGFRLCLFPCPGNGRQADAAANTVILEGRKIF